MDDITAHKHSYKFIEEVESHNGAYILHAYLFTCKICDIEFFVSSDLFRNVIKYGCADGYYIGGPLPQIEDVRPGMTILRRGPAWKTYAT